MSFVFNPKALIDYALKRLTEKSTWLGITGLISAAGVVVSPELADRIAAAGVSIASLILVAWKES